MSAKSKSTEKVMLKRNVDLENFIRSSSLKKLLQMKGLKGASRKAIYDLYVQVTEHIQMKSFQEQKKELMRQHVERCKVQVEELKKKREQLEKTDSDDKSQNAAELERIDREINVLMNKPLLMDDKSVLELMELETGIDDVYKIVLPVEELDSSFSPEDMLQTAGLIEYI